MKKLAIKQSEREETMDKLAAFPDEVAYLNEINQMIVTSLSQAECKVDQVDKEYIDFKQYMSDYRGEIDPHEMFQNSMLLKQIDQTGADKVNVMKKLKLTKDAPYFARIDFQEADKQLETIYIGRFSFMYDHELLIIDWRSPLASVFYDYEIGPASYDAPIGHIQGNLLLKRQFKIEQGILKYVLESSLHIQDNLLQDVLSNTSDEKMKSIISTIQKEQNQIVRDEKANTLVIQGVAGSGKTSIALHRISYLLYRFKDRLSSKNVTILSPNNVFADYISTVLPELGDEPIQELSFIDVAMMELKGNIRFDRDKDPQEVSDEAWAKRVRYKSTLAFVKQIDHYLQALSTELFQGEAYTYKCFRIEADEISKLFYAYRKTPIKKRCSRIAEEIYERFTKANRMGYTIPRPSIILKSINKMLVIKNSLALYKAFYTSQNHPEMFVLVDKHTLEWTDVFPYLYVQAFYEGIQENTTVKHLVIDEMQDYTPIQYALINRLFPCQKTILGDFRQCIHPYHEHTLHDMSDIYKEANFIELNTSYRSTYEIITFANTIVNIPNIKPMKRHGEHPQLLACNDEQDMLHKVKNTIETFLSNEHASLGIIVKSNAYAKALYEQLMDVQDIHFISMDSAKFKNGISITSVQMSKGLEFDEVVVLNVNEKQYASAYERGLLYIAATRAMHVLTILYTGIPSVFLNNKTVCECVH